MNMAGGTVVIKSNIKLVTGRLIEQGVLLEDKMSAPVRPAYRL